VGDKSDQGADLQARSKTGAAEKLCCDLKAYIYKTYTVEAEKRVFNEVFPELRKAS
jgi:hypothetical protein